MDKWEYITETYQGMYGWTSRLNRMGSLGWECVAIIPDGQHIIFVAVFKKKRT
jgi:hypothetical protein